MTIIVLWILLGLIALIVILLHFSVTAEISANKKSVDFKIKYMSFTIYPRPPKKKKARKHKREKPKQENMQFEENLEDDFIGIEENSADVAPPEIPIEQMLEQEAVEVAPLEEETERSESQTSYAAEEHKENEISENPETDGSDDLKADEKAEKEPSEENKTSAESKPKKDNEKENKKSGGRLDDIKSKWTKVKPYIPMGWKYFKKLLKKIRITDVKIQLTVGKEDAYEAAMFYGKIQGALFNLIALLSGIFTVKIKKADVNCVFDKKTFDGEAYAVIRIRPSTIIAIAVCMGVSFLKIFLPDYLKRRKNKKADKKQNDKKVGAETAEI